MGEGSNLNYEALAQYIDYGLSYDAEKNNYLFNNKAIRLFIDEDEKNKGQFNKMYFNNNGEINVKVIRGANNEIVKLDELREDELKHISDFISQLSKK